MEQLSILSINVEFFKEANPRQFAELIIEVNPDIVLIQEDVISDNQSSLQQTNLIKEYIHMGSCKAQKLGIGFLGNSIFIRKNLSNKSETLSSITLKGCSTPRCSIIVKVNNIIIANVHLCGGFLDDAHFRKLKNIKSLEIEQLFQNVKNIDIIAGDFNAESETTGAITSLNKYDRYNRLNEEEKLQFLKYYTSFSEILNESEFLPADQIGSTNVFGGISDWFFFNYKTCKQINFKKIEMINKKLSDHNGIFAIFEKEIEEKKEHKEHKKTINKCELDLNCKVQPTLCFGTFPMKENTYLYHGSPVLFESPYELKGLDNRLSPTPHIPSHFATKQNKMGFIYEYKATKNILELGGIPDILFACGKFSDIQDKLENQITELCLKHKCFEKVKERRQLEEKLNFRRASQSSYDDIILSICYTPFNGIFIPGYENQIMLCSNKNINFIEINNIYFVIRYSPTKSFNAKINMKESKKYHIVLQDKSIDLYSKLKESDSPDVGTYIINGTGLTPEIEEKLEKERELKNKKIQREIEEMKKKRKFKTLVEKHFSKEKLIRRKLIDKLIQIIKNKFDTSEEKIALKIKYYELELDDLIDAIILLNISLEEFYNNLKRIINNILEDLKVPNDQLDDIIKKIQQFKLI